MGARAALPSQLPSKSCSLHPSGWAGGIGEAERQRVPSQPLPPGSLIGCQGGDIEKENLSQRLLGLEGQGAAEREKEGETERQQ